MCSCEGGAPLQKRSQASLTKAQVQNVHEDLKSSLIVGLIKMDIVMVSLYFELI